MKRKGHWRTARPIEPFSIGRNATERVNHYIALWRRRCYSSGIPDEVPQAVADSGRAPSWKAVALCILRNDLHFYGLGFAAPTWEAQQATLAKACLATSGAFPDGYQLELLP